MPRKARIDAAGALHHIVARGIEKRRIFDDDTDRYAFLKRLGHILEDTRTTCYAWALMPNHFHLLLRTGTVPVATVMRRLLTGHAIAYNHRHGRHGHLFQNRYKSILCQEDAYFLELVRYIHLNPLRAGLVKDVHDLERYPFCGHGAVVGKHDQSWQDSHTVLARFGKQVGPARRHYTEFVAKGVEQGRREDLVGGGLIRSAGGWEAVKAMRSSGIHGKSDERILGDGDFVTEILAEAEESMERRQALLAQGVDVDAVAAGVAHLLEMPANAVWQPGRQKRLVAARSLISFWAVRELGVSMSSLARRFNISVVAVSRSVQRGEHIAAENGYVLNSLLNLN